MIWVYTTTESNELQARDAGSRNQLQGLDKEVNWLWIDSMDPDDKELKIIADLLEGAEIITAIKEQKLFSRPERVDDSLLFSVPLAVFNTKLETFPIYFFIKKRTLLTVRNKHFSKVIKNTLRIFEDCIGKICEQTTNSSFIISRLFHEISNENLNVVMALRENIDNIEEEALANPADKKIGRSVFVIKREISTLERILWTQRELMLSIKEGVILMIETSEESAATLKHATDNISRELALLSSYNNTLDSILRLQDLGMIHKVERKLIYLTLMALVVSVLLILLDIDILSLLPK